VLSVLADGQRITHENLSTRLGISLEQLKRVLAQLVGIAVPLNQNENGVALSISASHHLLDTSLMLKVLASTVRERIDELKVHALCTSTNDLLEADELNSWRSFNVAIADSQTAGRGRQGHRWISPFGGGLYVSLSTHWTGAADMLASLPLAIGVAVAEQLQAFITLPVKLKWPNDLIVEDQKLGGLLLESRPHPNGGSRVLIGLGINLVSPLPGSVPLKLASDRTLSAFEPVGIAQLVRDGVAPNRSILTAMVLNSVVAAVDKYRDEGFYAFRQRWQARDYLFERNIVVHNTEQNTSVSSGVAHGVDETGALRVTTNDGEVAVRGGEISVRCS